MDKTFILGSTKGKETKLGKDTGKEKRNFLMEIFTKENCYIYTLFILF